MNVCFNKIAVNVKINLQKQILKIISVVFFHHITPYPERMLSVLGELNTGTNLTVTQRAMEASI